MYSWTHFILMGLLGAFLVINKNSLYKNILNF